MTVLDSLEAGFVTVWRLLAYLWSERQHFGVAEKYTVTSTSRSRARPLLFSYTKPVSQQYRQNGQEVCTTFLECCRYVAKAVKVAEDVG